MTETGQLAANVSLKGDKKYLKQARKAMPILVRQAKAEQPLTYGDLAEELGMPNPRNLNYVLGAIGNVMLELSELWEMDVPPIQTIVVNQSTGLPGEGISWFAPDAKSFKKASRKQRDVIVKGMLWKVYHFDQWDLVLRELELDPAPELPAKPAEVYLGKMGGKGGTGETPAHKGFKKLVADNPEVLGLSGNYGKGEIEHTFGSSDAVDVLFIGKSDWVAVEVKSRRSDQNDIVRGLYQCVKYLALAEAEIKVRQLGGTARCILALEADLPGALIGLRNTLGVEVVDRLGRTFRQEPWL